MIICTNIRMLSNSRNLLFFIAAMIVPRISECAKNYCNSNTCGNTKQHTLCRFQSNEPAKNCLDAEVTIRGEEDRQAILDKLNNRRNKVAAGEIRSLPASANMMKLEWNEELELSAQRWANQCVRYSSPDLKDTCRDLGHISRLGTLDTLMINVSPDGVFVEQNIATIYGESPGLTVTALVDVWYMELLSINDTILSRYRESMEGGFNHYEYFSQLVWAKSTDVGCGGVKFKDRDNGNRMVYRLVCNFAPGGNRGNQSVYAFGLPCSDCPENTVCDATFAALCGKLPDPTTKNSITDNISKLEPSAHSTVPSNIDTTTAVVTIDSDDETFTPFDFFLHVNEHTRQLVTPVPTKHDCKDSVDNFLNLIRKRLSNDPAFKELLFSTKPSQTVFVDTSFTDPKVAAFVSKLYSKKHAPTTTKITNSDLLNSTLLVDLVEAVIFRSSGGYDKMQVTLAEHTTHYADISPVRVQAELARIQENRDFTGHYFFPEDVTDEEESTDETTDAYYDATNPPIKDIMMEIEDIKKGKVTNDFLDDIFETDLVIESTTSFRELSPDDMNLYKSGRNVMKKFLENITEKTSK